MIDVSNRVLSNIETYIYEYCQNVQSDSTKSPPGFPAVSVEQIDCPEYALDFQNNENAVQSTVEIQVFSDKDITDARKIASMVCDAMRVMGYRRTYGPTKNSNAADTNIHRIIARFVRIVNSVDDIERF